MNAKGSGENRADFYGVEYEPAEARDLRTVQADDLQSEINMLRVVMRRVLAHLNSAEAQPGQLVSTLKALGTACHTLSRLLKTQRELSDKKSDLETKLQEVLERINQDIKGLP